MDYLHPLAFGLRSHLRRLATNPGIPYAGRPMAHWRYHFWDGLLYLRPDPIIRF